MPQLKQGILISVEGIDGSGKSTLTKNLFTIFQENKYTVLLTREPGGTQFGSKIRELIIHSSTTPLCSKTQYLLFAADRAQHFEEIIIPALQSNTLIISDRLADSSLAYQCYGNGLSIDMVTMINQWTMNDIKPDLTLYVRVPVDIALERVVQRNNGITSFEKKEFLEKVFHGFEMLYKNRTDVILLDGTQPSELLTHQAFKAIATWLENNAFLL